MIDWQAMQLTLELAFIVAGSLFVLGLPLAWWLTFSTWRIKFLVEALVGLPLILPPTVLGFYLLVAFGSQSLFGRWYQSLTGHTLAFSFAGLVIGSILYSFPFAVQPFAASFAAVDRDLLAASSVLGASRWRTFWRIVVPLSIPGLITGLVLGFAHTVGEFGVVLMIGGNIPGVTRTISIDIYDRVQAAEYASANHTALILLAFSFAILALVYGLNRRIWAVYPFR